MIVSIWVSKYISEEKQESKSFDSELELTAKPSLYDGLTIQKQENGRLATTQKENT